ncbi:MAG: ribulose-phosphate 3-epimerase [Bacteroidaceae bacterium]|nr:ribulose-phosphate 3-epimerase [Bacteroidaceae bacterium]
MSTIVSPSLLSADFGNLDRDIEMLNSSKADWIHLDVMDGVFVPNISLGFPVMQAVAAKSVKPLDVHLMIVNPEKFIDRFAKMGVYMLNVHYEACTHLHKVIHEIKEKGMKAAVTLNPSTPVCVLEDIVNDVDMVLLMTVNPGFGGQKFIEHSIEKVARLRRLIQETGSEALIEVDGGVNQETAPRLVSAGANVLVAGNSVFNSPDPKSIIERFKQL